MQNRHLTTIFFVVFIDMLGFGLILPLLPYYADTFGATPFVTGLLVASYAAAQLLGAPFLGRLSDRFGRKPILVWSIFGTAVGFVLLGIADNLWILFAGRILDGLTGGNIPVAQAYISDVTDSSNRARGLGLIGAAFGMGFIIGPATGGFLSQWGYGTPAFAAAGLALCNLLAVIIWLPESRPPDKHDTGRQHGVGNFSLKAMRRQFARPVVGTLLWTRFIFSMAFSTFQSIFSLYALYRFDLEATATGYILAYVGVLVILVQGVIVGRLAKFFDELNLVIAAVALMGLSLLGWAFAPTIPILLAIMIPIAIAGGTHNTVINSAMSKEVEPFEVGGLLGLSSSVESFTRVFAPSIGGFLLGSVGTFAPGVFGALLLVSYFPFVLNKLRGSK